jgi:cytoskeletal protein RodZ
MAESHWRLGHRRQGGSSGPSPSSEGFADTGSVGRMLRRHREERGIDLRQVAEVLCIRHPYLKAIEDGRIEELPGSTYAVGFVKAYSDHLGLDSDVVVERFKAEQQGLNSKTELVFPSPLPEGKVPSVAILVVAVILSVGAYTGWVYFSDDDKKSAEAVPPLPAAVEKMAAKTETAAETKPVAETPAATAETAPENAAVVAPPQTPAETEPEAQAAAQASPDARPGTPAEEKSAPASGGMTVSIGAAEVSASASQAAQAAAAAPRVATAPPAPPEPSPAETTVQHEAAEKPALNAVREPKEYGDRNSGSSIVMLAISPTWIEIRDTERDEILLTRVLYSGDRYYPPNRSGLVMMTGNAGGIEISVDGKKVPPIGRKGDVKRDVSLNPELLLQRRSVAPVIGLQPQQSQATTGAEAVQ